MTRADFPDSFYEMAATREIQDLSGNAHDFDRAKWIKIQSIFLDFF
jgi:hypothetical protein